MVYELGPFRLDTKARVLTLDGVATSLGARGVAVLAALVTRAGEYLEVCIVYAAWPGVVVEDANLAVQIGSDTARARAGSRGPALDRDVDATRLSLRRPRCPDSGTIKSAFDRRLAGSSFGTARCFRSSEQRAGAGFVIRGADARNR